MKERVKAARIPDERKIIVTIIDKNAPSATTIPPIPRDEDTPDYDSAVLVFINFYADVLKYMRSVSGLNIEEECQLVFEDKVSLSVRFNVVNRNTGNIVYYLFELHLSNHIVPKCLVFFSLNMPTEENKKYEEETGDNLEPSQLDFIVNNITQTSYNEAFEEVKKRILLIVGKEVKTANMQSGAKRLRKNS